MVNLAFAHGAKGWFACGYHNDPIWIRGSCKRSLTGPFLTFSDLWSELGQRMAEFSALAPLFLQAAPADALRPWFQAKGVAHARSLLPTGMPPITQARLQGPDFDLHCVVGNDTREMTTLYIEVLDSVPAGLEFYDLSEFLRTRRWAPMERRRHIEMFPGQFQFVLAAPPNVCTRWRDITAQGLIAADRCEMTFDLVLLRAYGVDVGPVEAVLARMGRGAIMDDLATMRRARDMVFDRVYDTPALCETRSKIIEANAVVCACDGALCRLMRHGNEERVRQLGLKVIPFARQFTNMRLELRRGRGAAILEPCKQLVERSRQVLAEIRALAREN